MNEDQSNKGNTSMIWLNDQCGGNIGDCDVDPGQKDITITDFFDFSRPSSEVNAQLNSQSIPIQAGTYRYLRMEFCRRGPGSDPSTYANNIEYKFGSMTEPHGFKLNMCTVTVPIEPALVVAEGEAFNLTLNYDFSKIIQVMDSKGSSDSCTQTTPYACLDQINFVPSIARVN
jgi:hypothetical protein